MKNFEFDEDFWNTAPYGLNKTEKKEYLLPRLIFLTEMHRKRCPPYGAMLDRFRSFKYPPSGLEDIPFIPVRLFKLRELKSIEENNVARVVTSSGTGGQAVSRIYLDRETSFRQIKTLHTIISSYIGKKRLPLLLLDTDAISRDPRLYSVRGSGLMGFSMFGKRPFFALDRDMNLNIDGLQAFLKQNADEPVLMTGYTWIIWQYIVEKLEKKGIKLNIAKACLFHGGGWKKLKDKSVDSQEFNRCVRSAMGNVEVYNYYGMAEQLGSIFTECECGYLHAPIFSDVLIRRHQDFSVAGFGEKGLLQLLSILPSSYPGHSILTEDEGTVIGEDDCPCGRKGKYFVVHGRIRNAELRGCGDTFEKR